jgi:hypothetical protein
MADLEPVGVKEHNIVSEKKKKAKKARHPTGIKQKRKIPRKVQIQTELEEHKDEDCPLCMEKTVDMILECGHVFHRQCLHQQLDAKWSGVRIGFNHIQCAMCRAEISMPELHLDDALRNKINEALALKKKIETRAMEKVKEDSLFNDFKGSDEELLKHAMEKLAFYKCVDCSEPYCGGMVDCGRDLEINEKELRCQQCVFKKEDTNVRDLRCLAHGYKHAMFKCDSCCSIATWDCIYNHYCDRCHSQASSVKNYPCPGNQKCPLGIPHPPNHSAVHCQEEIVPFVIGCMKCIGWDQENVIYGGAKHVF